MKAALALLVWLTLTAAATAQTFPNRPIRVLEPLAAGSSVDVITRIVVDKMGQLLGGSLYVENEAGAAGLLGMRAGLRAAPDGYTLLAVNDSVLTVLPNLRKDARYDPRTDFVPIIEMARLHWALVGSPALGMEKLSDLITAARAKPGEINYASGGIGSPQHIAMELFMRQADIKLTHIPFRGVTPAMNEVVAGHVPVMFAALPTPLPFVPDHRVVLLGVADPKRLPTLPDVPTLDEAGLPGFTFYAWGALLAPKGTPATIIDKLHDAAAAALHDPGVRKQLEDLGYEVTGGSADSLKTLIANDYTAKAKLLQDANIHAE